MLREMSSSQLTEWIAFYKEFPPDEAEFFRTGIIASAVYNTAQTGSKGQKKTFKPTDFMPKREKEQLSPEQLLGKVRQINEELGGRDRRNR